MANIKSAKKRIKVNAAKQARNKSVKSNVKTAVKRFLTAVDSNDKEAASVEILNTKKTIAGAQSKGIFHKKTASRKIARLSKRLEKM